MPKQRNYKKELARRMMTLDEIRNHVSPFNCANWVKRFRAKQNKIRNK